MIPIISTITPTSGIFTPSNLSSQRNNPNNYFRAVVKCFSTKNRAKKSSKKVEELRRNSTIQKISKTSLDNNEYIGVADKEASFSDEAIGGPSNDILLNDWKNSRSVVLQACTVTSGLILALGLVIRQISHIAFIEGLPVIDCSAEVSLNFETWHLGVIAELVILISSCRYLLLQTWSDFAESSEAANQQVLSSLQPVDYMVVAFLPGFSEELLFRGALLPLFGLNWVSALVVAVIFGALHLGSGRKYSFAIWCRSNPFGIFISRATFVGFAYGYATILSSSIIVPIASHALNNLIGGILWRYTSNTTLEE